MPNFPHAEIYFLLSHGDKAVLVETKEEGYSCLSHKLDLGRREDVALLAGPNAATKVLRHKLGPDLKFSPQSGLILPVAVREGQNIPHGVTPADFEHQRQQVLDAVRPEDKAEFIFGLYFNIEGKLTADMLRGRLREVESCVASGLPLNTATRYLLEHACQRREDDRKWNFPPKVQAAVPRSSYTLGRPKLELFGFPPELIEKLTNQGHKRGVLREVA